VNEALRVAPPPGGLWGLVGGLSVSPNPFNRKRKPKVNKTVHTGGMYPSFTNPHVENA
jgi:hypothetical protein